MAIGTSGVSVPSIGQSIDTSIYGNKEAPKGMSLSDIVDLSRSSLALKKERELYEPSVEAAKATSESAQISAKKAKAGLSTDFADKMRQNQIALINHPLIVRAEQDPQFAAANKDKIAQLVNTQAKAAEELGLDPTQASELNAPYLEAVNQTNGQGLRQFLKTRMNAGLDQQAQASLQPKEYFQAAPTAQKENQGGNQAQTMPVEPHNQPEKLPYQPVMAGQPRSQVPSEIKDTAEGQTYRSSLVNRQSSLTTDRRNIDEVIKTANELEKSYMPTSGIAGSAYRHLATWMGDPTYKQLGKDLANVQMANIKAQGGSLDTVAGQQLSKMANGDETYPPSVLMSIAARAKADMTNIDAQATAAQKFSQKFGDNNMKAFQQMWSKNADSKIFEVMNLAKDTNLDLKEKKKIVDHLLGNDPKERAIFNEKYQNILKLQQNGTL